MSSLAFTRLSDESHNASVFESIRISTEKSSAATRTAVLYTASSSSSAPGSS